MSSGVPGLDPLVGGGFPLHRTVLICGDIGTGKTTLGLQFLMDGVKQGEAGVLVSVDEKPQHLIEDARRLGWDVSAAVGLQRLTILDTSPYFMALRGKSGLDARHVASDLAQQVRRAKAVRLVIDGVTSLAPGGATGAGVEDFVRSLINSLEDNLGCTTVLIARTSDGAHPSALGPAAERLTSGVIELAMGPLAWEGAPVSRDLLIRKMRGAPVVLGKHRFEIVDGRGIVIHDVY